MISGTTGLLGCADGALLMQKEKRTDSRATLEVVGRDQPDQRLYLSKDQESLVWGLDHAENELWKQPPDPVLEAVAKIVEDFARRNGLPNPTHFTDDGVSGTRFDRPGFLAMMEAVEAGRVEAIVIKDMSRLGRDYLKVGQVMEILRQRGVRLIAINEVWTV